MIRGAIFRRAFIPVLVALLAVAVLSFWRGTGVHEVAVAPGVAAATTLPEPAADDLPWWRGPQLNGVSQDTAARSYPIRWSSDENIRWKSPVPGVGHASPCISGDQVFVFTADEEAQTHWLLSFDRSSGEEQWRAQLNQGGLAKQHRKNSHASATPACDGQRVFVAFTAHGNLWVAAIDRTGQVIWKKEAGPYESTHGFGSSPALYGGLVIVAADNRGARIDRLVGSSFLAALDRESGDVVWRIKRPATDNYAAPIVARVAGKPQLLLPGHETIVSYDPATGGEIWRCRWKAANTACTAAFDDRHIYVTTTEHDPLILCIRADGEGDVTDTHVVWRQTQGASYVPSPLVLSGRLYLVSDKGVMTCLDAATGAQRWRKRLGGDFSASPVAAGGLIYAANEAGKVYVLRPGDPPEVVAENDCGEALMATPGCCGGQIFVRGKQSLLCISSSPQDATAITRRSVDTQRE